MIYKAHSEDTKKLVSLPESGMGYQWIEARRALSNFYEKFLVLNAQLLIEVDDLFNTYKRVLLQEGFKSVYHRAEPLNISTSSIKIIPPAYSKPESRNLNEYKNKEIRRYAGNIGAKDSALETANGKEMFIRLSAYENDRRVDLVKRRLIDGSYCTTLVDYADCVVTNDDPLDRYAIPSDEEIQWAFYIEPKSGDLLQRGIVQPAYGHDGGGVEAYFPDGTSNNTYLFTRPYGT